MKITVQIDVPDGEFCHGCDLWWRDKEIDGRYCLLFGMVELSARYKANMVTGIDIVKCAQCQTACKQSVEAES